MKRTRLAQRGARSLAEQEEYSAAKEVLEREARGRCAIGPLIAGVDPRHRCSGRYDAPHHLRKTGQGGSKINRANMVAACNPCNGWVEDEPDLARSLGLVVREGDDEWERLGRRAQKMMITTPNPGETHP